VTTERGKPMCVNPQPDPLGTVVIVDGPDGPRAQVLRTAELYSWKGQRWMPHFATCSHVTARTGTKRTS